MIKSYIINEEEESLYDPIKLLILIYLWQDDAIPQKHINRCRLNANINSETYRTDLEFYIPQLCNFLVYHKDLKDNYLLTAMEKASKLSYTFGHIYYFYMASLEKIISPYEIQTFKPVEQYNL